jgi:hypothetical protein
MKNGAIPGSWLPLAGAIDPGARLTNAATPWSPAAIAGLDSSPAAPGEATTSANPDAPVLDPRRESAVKGPPVAAAARIAAGLGCACALASPTRAATGATGLASVASPELDDPDDEGAAAAVAALPSVLATVSTAGAGPTTTGADVDPDGSAAVCAAAGGAETGALEPPELSPALPVAVVAVDPSPTSPCAAPDTPPDVPVAGGATGGL